MQVSYNQSSRIIYTKSASRKDFAAAVFFIIINKFSPTIIMLINLIIYLIIFFLSTQLGIVEIRLKASALEQ